MATGAVVRSHVAAERVGLAVETLRKLRQNNRGPAYEKHGRLIYYRVDDLDAWLEAQVTDRVATSERVA
jgi:hypothetical protein